jgi:hypothetical protein
MDLNHAVRGWYIGFIIAFAIILIVVALVATITQLARKIGVQAADIADVLDECRINTASMPRVGDINIDTQRISGGMDTVRALMTS